MATEKTHPKTVLVHGSKGIKTQAVLLFFFLNNNFFSNAFRCWSSIPMFTKEAKRKKQCGFVTMTLLKLDFTGRTQFFREYSLKNINLIKGRDAVHATDYYNLT